MLKKKYIKQNKTNCRDETYINLNTYKRIQIDVFDRGKRCTDSFYPNIILQYKIII